MPHHDKPGTLVLIRHGESEYNARGVWTGLTDTPLTEKGRGQAKLMAEALADLHPDAAFASALIRAQDTLDIMIKTAGWDVPVEHAAALNERDYGDLTALNKWEVQKQYGDEQFNRWRRGWDDPVPGGETLKDTSARAVPYFEEHILPLAKAGQTVVVSAHGNSLRALIKHLDHISDADVAGVEIRFGEIVMYTIGSAGHVEDKTIRKIDTEPTNA